MLVLKRRLRERIIITVKGERIVIEVNELGPGFVRLGIEAAREHTIHREEIQQRIDLACAWCRDAGVDFPLPAHETEIGTLCDRCFAGM